MKVHFEVSNEVTDMEVGEVIETIETILFDEEGGVIVGDDFLILESGQDKYRIFVGNVEDLNRINEFSEQFYQDGNEPIYTLDEVVKFFK